MILSAWCAAVLLAQSLLSQTRPASESRDCDLPPLEQWEFPLDRHPHTEGWVLPASFDWRRPQEFLRWKQRDGKLWPATVEGELDDSDRIHRFHWWLVDLPAGTYRLVLQPSGAGAARHTDRETLQWFSTQAAPLQVLGQTRTNELPLRRIFNFHWSRGQRLLLRYASDFGRTRYQMGIFEPASQIEIPFFGHPRPLPAVLSPGETKVMLLSPVSPAAAEAYYRARLCAGSYLVTAHF